MLVEKENGDNYKLHAFDFIQQVNVPQVPQWSDVRLLPDSFTQQHNGLNASRVKLGLISHP